MRFPRPSRFIRKLSTTSEKVPVDINVIRVKNMPVLHMLRLEESLFRYDSNNWCVINSGTPPCVVVGRSSVIEDTVRVENTRAAGIPIIRRFTGGGVVYADANTLFVSLISRAKGGLAGREAPFPNAIMQWSAAWYGAHCFPNLNWGLQSGQDFAVGNRKVGGNAQSFGGGRWVHHTSFLHDADYGVMSAMLSLPKKQPDWRNHRDHRDFLTTLRESNSSRSLDHDASTIYNALRHCGLFIVHDVSISDIQVTTTSELFRTEVVQDASPEK